MLYQKVLLYEYLILINLKHKNQPFHIPLENKLLLLKNKRPHTVVINSFNSCTIAAVRETKS